jgi:hypothetical protein
MYSTCAVMLSFVLASSDFEHSNLPATTGMKRWLECEC